LWRWAASRPPRPDRAAVSPGPPCGVMSWLGVGWATRPRSRSLRPVVCGCFCGVAAEVDGVGACRALAEGPSDGRTECCGAARGADARGAAACGAGRGAAACGAACRGAATRGAGLGAEACGGGAARGAGAACGAGPGRDAGAACGAGPAGRAAGGPPPPPPPGPPPPPPLCGCAAAVVAIAAETMKHAAIRFHWNMVPPPASPAIVNVQASVRFRARAARTCDTLADCLFRMQEAYRRVTGSRDASLFHADASC
jgi:hypothetical protein